MRRGNIDAFAPTDAKVFQAIQCGRVPDLLTSETMIFNVPEQPDFLVAGDFNRDGFKDIVAATRGGDSFYFLAGTGDGNFKSVEQIQLSGAVTTIAAGDFNRFDGFSNLAIGTNGADGAKVLIFDSAKNAFQNEPRQISLSTAADSLAFGQLDADSFFDLAVNIGNAIEIVHATGDWQTEIPETRIERIELPFAAQAVTLGTFVWNRENRPTMTVLADDGEIQIIQPADLNT